MVGNLGESQTVRSLSPICDAEKTPCVPPRPNRFLRLHSCFLASSKGTLTKDTPPYPCYSPSVNIRCTISLLARTLRVSERAVLRRAIRFLTWKIQLSLGSLPSQAPLLALGMSKSDTVLFPVTAGMSPSHKVLPIYVR